MHTCGNRSCDIKSQYTCYTKMTTWCILHGVCYAIVVFCNLTLASSALSFRFRKVHSSARTVHLFSFSSIQVDQIPPGGCWSDSAKSQNIRHVKVMWFTELPVNDYCFALKCFGRIRQKCFLLAFCSPYACRKRSWNPLLTEGVS